MKHLNTEEFIKKLTEKQYNILACLLYSVSYKLIAKTLNISDRTVEGHVRAMLKKAGFNNRLELIQVIKITGGEQVNKKFQERFEQLTQSTLDINKGKKIFRVLKYIIICAVIIPIFFIWRNEKSEDTVFHAEFFTKSNMTLLQREELLNKIKKYDDNFDITIICGYGGAGKTILAEEYLQRGKFEISYEINAESFNSLSEGMLGLAYLLAKTKDQKEELSFLNGINNPREKLKHLSLFVYLQLKKHNNWCILFDNVEDFHLLNQMCLYTMPRKDYMKNGQILITTRNCNFSERLANVHVIEVKELTKEEKELLFKKITKKKLSFLEKKLLVEIPSYPLDVSCCAYYIKNTNISLKEYLKRMKSGNAIFWNSAKKLILDNTDYSWTRKEIIASIMEQIVKANSEFKDILFIISLMDSQNISLDFFYDMAEKTLIDALKFYLMKFKIASFFNNGFSFHRSTHALMKNYFFKTLNIEEQKHIIKKFIKVLEPYTTLHLRIKKSEELIPHLKSLEKNIDRIKGIEYVNLKINAVLGFLLKEKDISALEAIPYFNKCLELNKKEKKLSELEKNKILLAAGEACLISNRNDLASSYLNKSFIKSAFSQNEAIYYAKNYIFIGIVQMRNNDFSKAKQSLNYAIEILDKIKTQNLDIRLTKAKAFLNQGLNYFLYYINKPQMRIAIGMMEKAITLVSNDKDNEEALKLIANAKIRMAGAYNSLKEYKKAIILVKDAEQLLEKLQLKDNNYFCSLGLMLMEKGHATLRLNNLETARVILKEAHKLFDKTMIGDHVFRVRMQEAETLIRLGYYEEAFKNCEYVFEKKDKERNYYNDLFFCTAYYNAAVIKYKIKDYNSSLAYFQKFSSHIKSFCEKFLSKEEYTQLVSENVFRPILDISMIKKCFEDAYKIYSIVCLRGSEFITDYVKKNYENCK